MLRFIIIIWALVASYDQCFWFSRNCCLGYKKNIWTVVLWRQSAKVFSRNKWKMKIKELTEERTLDGVCYQTVSVRRWTCVSAKNRARSLWRHRRRSADQRTPSTCWWADDGEEAFDKSYSFRNRNWSGSTRHSHLSLPTGRQLTRGTHPLRRSTGIHTYIHTHIHTYIKYLIIR